MAEVKRSEALILYAESEDFPLKGAYIEVGIALAAGIPVRLVLSGVTLEPRSSRPIGSWIAHPLVSRHHSVQEAIDAARSAPETGAASNAPAPAGQPAQLELEAHRNALSRFINTVNPTGYEEGVKAEEAFELALQCVIADREVREQLERERELSDQLAAALELTPSQRLGPDQRAALAQHAAMRKRAPAESSAEPDWKPSDPVWPDGEREPK